MASSVTNPCRNYPFLEPASQTALLSRLLSEDQSSEDCPDPQRKREDHQTCEADGKSAEAEKLFEHPDTQRKRDYRWRKANGESLPPRQLSDHPEAQRARAYRWRVANGESLPPKQLSNSLAAQKKRAYRQRLADGVSPPPRQLSNSPAAQKARKRRLRAKEEKLRAEEEKEAELNLLSQNIQQFIDLSRIDKRRFAPPDAQSSREDHQTCEVDGKIVEVRLLSNHSKAKEGRRYRPKRAGNMELPLSDLPAAQSRRGHCQTHEVDGKAMMEVKLLSDNPVAKQTREYRFLKKQREKAKKESELVLQSIGKVISKNESVAELSNDFGQPPSEPAFSTYAGLPSWENFSDSAACSSNIDRRSSAACFYRDKIPSNGFDPSHSQWA